MTAAREPIDLAAFTGSGALAGALSALVFCILHHLLISPIWFAFVANVVAGAVSGACLAWSYGLAVRNRTRWTWAAYNASFVIILVALAATSLVMFEPVTTIPALLAAKAPPRALIGRALPVTFAFTGVASLLLSVRYRAGWLASGAIFLTAIIIVLFLGLNLSVLGLVAVPRSLLYVLGEVLALLLGLAAVYAATMAYVWRDALRPRPHSA